MTLNYKIILLHNEGNLPNSFIQEYVTLHKASSLKWVQTFVLQLKVQNNVKNTAGASGKLHE